MHLREPSSMAVNYVRSFTESDSSAEEMETYQQWQWEKNETEEQVFYKTKKIEYRGETKRIILQDKNGPCPLIAICNVLILRGQINLHSESSEESQVNLLTHVAEILVDEIEDEYIDLELLKRLTKGIDVDLKFKSIKDFVVTPELALFDLLKIPLYHGWLVDPQDLEVATAIGGRSYDALTIELTALDTQTVVKARSGQISGECSVGFDASITATPSQLGSKTISFADSPPASAEHHGHLEEEEMLLKALTLSKREVLLKGSFDTHRESNEGEGEVVSGSSDDTLVTSLDAAAGCTVTIGTNICQLRFDHQFPTAISEDRKKGCVAGNKINVGKEACLTTSITKSSEAHDHDQLSSVELGDETFGDVETENSSKVTDVHVTSSEAPISVEKTNLESTKNDIVSEVPVKNDNQSSSEENDMNGLTQEEGRVIKEFLKDSASQLTWHGLFTLEDELKNEELCVLYRNNHFSTMLKYDDDKLFTLVTDQGYLMEQDLVWERLNQISGDSVFVTGNFKVLKSDSGKSRKWDQQRAINKTEDVIYSGDMDDNDSLELDHQMAKELQQKLWAGDTGSEVPMVSEKRVYSSIQALQEIQRWQNGES